MTGLEERGCPVCGARVWSDAVFCHACGTQLDSHVVETASTTEQLERGPSRLRAIAVPLAVAAVLSAGIAALVTGGGSDADSTAIEDDAIATPEAEPTPTVEVPTPTPAPTLRPTPTVVRAAPDLVPSTLDPALVPDTDATHLVLLVGTDLAFLDLASGTWIVRERAGQIPSRGQGSPILVARDGVLTEESNGHIRHVPVQGPVQPLGPGWVVGVVDDRIYLRNFTSGSHPVRVVDPDGTVLEEIALPPQTWPSGVLPDGRLVVSGGGGVFVQEGSGFTDIGRGEARGVAAGSVLRFRCNPEAVCAYELVDPDSGDATVIPTDGLGGHDGIGYPVVAGDGRIHVYGATTVRTFSVRDNVATADQERSLFDFEAEEQTGDVVDPSGMTAGVRNQLVVITDGAGTVLAELEPPLPPSAFRGTNLAFVDLDR